MPEVAAPGPLPVGTPARPASHRGTIAYHPALDGLRALAVTSVIAYHFGVAGVPGGFLGVDVFFVLSGYLITSLLTAEWSGSGRVSLGAFWGRRARRLFPALGITLIGVSVAAAFLDAPGQLGQVRSDALSTLAYVANWHYIVASQNYFVRFGLPSPLLHTWSLAVEEQFYLVWPLITLGAVALARRLRPSSWEKGARRVLIGVSAAVAAGSSLEMALLYKAGHDPSRLYYGTDTHAQVILIGALLALLGPTASWAATRARRISLWMAGVLGALFAGWEVHAMLGRAPLHPGHGFAGRVGWFLHGVLGSPAFLYRGGFALVAVGVAAVIALVVSLDRSVASRALGFTPVRYVGRISYGLYLYHWPVFTFLSPTDSGLTGLALLAARCGITLGVSVASYHLVETPIRQGLRGKLSSRAQLTGLLPAGAACVVATLLIATSAPAAATARPPSATAATVPLPAGAHPASVLLVGDSVAMTMGIGLGPQDQVSRYNVQLDDQGQLGCGIVEGNTTIVLGGVQATQAPCDPFTHQDWQQFWGEALAHDHPDVVAVELGRWEVVNRLFEGHWTHIGDPAFDAYLTSQLSRAVTLLSSTGARVALLTAPYYDEGTAPNGSPWPEDDPARVDIWNGILRRVAAAHPSTVTLIDTGSLLDPGHHFDATVDKVAVRCPDGVHVSWQGGGFLAPLVLPVLERLAAAAYAHAKPGSSLTPVGAFTEPPIPTVAAAAAAVRDPSPAYCPTG